MRVYYMPLCVPHVFRGALPPFNHHHSPVQERDIFLALFTAKKPKAQAVKHHRARRAGIWTLVARAYGPELSEDRLYTGKREP